MQLILSYLQRKLRHKKPDIFILVSGSLFILPFVHSRATIDPVLLPQLIFWAVLTFLLLVIKFGIIVRDRMEIDLSILRRGIYPVFTCYLAVAGLSALGTINPVEAGFEWLKTALTLVFMATAGLIISTSKGSIKMVSRSATATGLVLALIGLCQYSKVAFLEIPGNYGVYATMANKNLLASALFMMLPFALYGLLQFAGCWYALSFLSLTLMMLVICLVQVRAVWVAIVFSATLILFFVVSKRRKKSGLIRSFGSSYRKRLVMILLGTFIGVAGQAIPRTITMPTPAVHAPSVNVEHQILPVKPLWASDTLRERLTLWKKTIRMAAEHPVLGVGPGQWRIYLPAYGFIHKVEPTDTGSGIKEIWFQRPHNDFLWVLAETGMVGFLCYVLFFVMLLYYAFRIAVYGTDKRLRIFSIVMLFGLIGYMVISSLSFPKERAFHGILLSLTAACLVSAYHRSFPTVETSVGRKKIYATTFLSLAVLTGCIIVVSLRFVSEAHTKSAIAEHKNQNWHRVISEIDDVNPFFYNLSPTSTPVKWYRGMAHFQMGKVSTALNDFRAAEKSNPYHVHVLNNLGTCYALQGDYKSAQQYYERLFSIAPELPVVLRNLNILSLSGKRSAGETDPTIPE